MSPESQRIAIAKACGWKEYHYDDGGVRYYKGIHHENSVSFSNLPLYLNDLNAMHEAEKFLDPVNQLASYIYQLQTICGGQFFGQNYLATANQRAEAFLKTLGLWTPPPPSLERDGKDL